MKIFNRAFPSRRSRLGRALARRKNVLTAIFALATIPNALLSCSAKNKTDNSGLQSASAASTAAAANQQPAQNQAGSQAAPSTTPNLDLTQMSATMIYSTIFDMLIMPEDYIDKNIKLKGWFETYTDPETSEMFYAVIVPDATACCQQGLEFVWPGNHTYPTDFPKPGEEITITGRYKLIETNGVSYTYIEANTVEF